MPVKVSSIPKEDISIIISSLVYPLSTSAQRKLLLAAPDCSISGKNVYNKLPQCNGAHINQYVDTWTDLHLTEEGRVVRNVFVKGNKHFNICVFLLHLI